MRRIVVSLLKGGVAKSETAVSLAHGLARHGYKVLLVDTDVQAQCNDMLGVEPEQGLAELIAGWADPQEALAEVRENLWLLAGGVPLAGVKMEIARREMAPEAVLDEALSCYEDEFDVMVMDTAPGWDTLLVNALYCSREVMSPVSMEPVALKGLRRFEERLGVIQKYQPALELKWIVPTFVDGRVKKTAHIMAQLQAEYGDRLTESIRYSVKLSEAPEFGKTIYEHDPRGAGAKGYMALVERVIREAPVGESRLFPPIGVAEPIDTSPVTVRGPAPFEPPAQPEELPEAVVASAAVEPLEAIEQSLAQTKPIAEAPLRQGPSVPEPTFSPPATIASLSDDPVPMEQETLAAAGPQALPPQTWEINFASQVERLLQEEEAPPAPGHDQQASFRAGAEDTRDTSSAEAPPPRQETKAPEHDTPKTNSKVWDLRERLKRVPVLSQRLTKGLNSGSR